MRRWVGVGMLAALVIAFALTEALTGDSGKGGGTRPAPALPDQVLVAPRATLASLRGKPAVIHFWASWCAPCRREAAQLARLPAALGSEARVVGIDWNDSLGGARSFVQRYGWRFQNLRDGSGGVGDRFLLSGLPTTYVLDARGRIRITLHGPQTVASVERALAGVA
jgi:cytochrome c biogenesis protein CcmG, thiol:disulfide interchange protein DsbE